VFFFDKFFVLRVFDRIMDLRWDRCVFVCNVLFTRGVKGMGGGDCIELRVLHMRNFEIHVAHLI